MLLRSMRMRPVTLLFFALLCGVGLIGCDAMNKKETPREKQAAARRTAAAPSDSAAPADPPTATKGGRNVEQRIEDAIMAARIKTKLAENDALHLFDFDPEVTDGEVTLQGNVATRAQWQEASRVAEEVDGVEFVTNGLRVDGQLIAAARQELAEAEEREEVREEARREKQEAGQERSEPLVADASQENTSRENTSSDEASADEASSDASQKKENASQKKASGEKKESAPVKTTYHTVESGQSLWTIARRYDTSIDRLRELNDLSGHLMPGDRLVVKKGTGGSAASPSVADAGSSGDGAVEERSSSSKSSGTYYTVKQGESLWIIARENDTTVDRLRELNDLASSRLMPGDRLRVN